MQKARAIPLLGANLAAASIAVCVAPVFGFAGPEPTAEEILPQVQAVLSRFFEALPSFECTETVDSRTWAGGKQRKTTHVVSSFTGIQKRSGRNSYTETRKKLSVDGKPIAEDARQPHLKGVFHFGGGFSSVLHETFSPENAAWQRYHVAGTDRIAGEDCLLLDMETDDMASKLFLDWLGKKVHPSASGRAWIWRRSMEVLRLERHYTGLPQRTTLNVSVEYSRAQIGEKQYLMPRTVRAWTTVAGSGRQETSEYVATYADYRKFDVATDITYQ